MATAGNIHLGAGDIWVTSDLTAAPSSGSDKTDPTTSGLMTMNTGYVSPSTTANPAWRNPGFTQGAATFTYRPTYYMVQTEQAFAEVVTNPTSEECTLAFMLLESTYQNYALATGQGTTHVASTPTRNAIHGGGKAGVNLNVLVLVSRKRTGVGYYLTTLYQAYSNDGIAINFERRAETRIAVTARALADATRPVGDQLFQLTEFPAEP